MVTRHSAFFVPVFEVELQGFISISAKRRIWKVGIPEDWNPSKSPKFSVWRFWGTREFTKLQVLYLQHIFWKISLFFLFLQWVQRRILFYEPSSFEYFLWQSKSYKVIRDFCFHHRCTPEKNKMSFWLYSSPKGKQQAIFAEKKWFVFIAWTIKINHRTHWSPINR